MEKIWDELKKIEAQAEQIRSDAQNNAKTITALAQQQAEKLLANGKTYADDEAQQLYVNAIEEANGKRDERLKANQQATEKLRVHAEAAMDKAVLAVVSKVLGEAEL